MGAVAVSSRPFTSVTRTPAMTAGHPALTVTVADVDSLAERLRGT